MPVYLIFKSNESKENNNKKDFNKTKLQLNFLLFINEI